MKRAKSNNIDLRAGKTSGMVESMRPIEEAVSISHTPRVFNLKEAPTFYPTTEEFSNPLDYIKKIQPSAESFGICKIVPPKLLSLKSCLNLKTIFLRQPERPSVITQTTSTRPDTDPILNSEDYIAQLFQYHSDNGQPIYKPPHLDHKPVDLYKLKFEVAHRGGFSKVTTEKKWAEIGRAMNYSGKTCTSLSNSLKTMYSKFVMPFELHIADSESSSPSKRPIDADSSNDTRMNGTNDDHETESINSDHSSLSYPTSNSKRSKRSRKERDRVSQNVTFDQTVPDPDYVVCEICNNGDDEGAMLLCDGCNRGFHIYCLRPPLKSIPTTDWFCPRCLGEVENFQQFGGMSLYSFRKNADKFKSKWFEENKNGKHKHLDAITSFEIEEEFWEVIENEYKEIGIDNIPSLPSAQYGGGFPTIEKNPSEDDALLSWNPNVISILPDSLFSHIKSNISELISPRLNIGMCFSSFPWKQEPHYTYLVDYMHIGETKTWYSVPAADNSIFETTMREYLSDSLKDETDFPFSLQTMISPKVLTNNSIQVFAIDQQQGEIIVTFPESYHASFSHGFDLGESVNFATSDWHRFGLACVNRYREYHKAPYFSHDNLLVTIAKDDQSIRTAVWLKDALKEMVNRELETRNQIRVNLNDPREVVDQNDPPMHQIQCSYCNAFCYLSSLSCECSTRTVCPDHFVHLCECEASRKYLRLRWSDEELKDIAQKVKERADIPIEWVQKLQSALLNNPVPSIEILKTLLIDAEKISIEIEEAAYLRQFVNRAEQWSVKAGKFLSCRNNNFTIAPDSPPDYADISVLISEAAALNLNSPEANFLLQLEEKIQRFKTKVEIVVNDENTDIEELQKLYSLGSSFNVEIEELSLLEKSISKKEWYKVAQLTHDKPHTPKVLHELISTARDHEISENDTTLTQLQIAQEQASQWEKRCALILKQDSITIEELKELLETSHNGVVIPNQVTQIRDMLSTAQKLMARANAFLEQGTNPDIKQRPNEKYLKDIINSFNETPIKTEELDLLHQALDAVQKWRNSLKETFFPHEADSNSFDVLYNILDNVNYCSRLNIEDASCSHGCFIFECSSCKTSERKSGLGQPKLEDLFRLLREVDQLKFIPEERNLLLAIVDSASTLKSQIRRFIASRDVSVDDTDQLKLYLHKTETMTIYLDKEILQLRQLLKIIETNSQVSPASTNSGEPNRIYIKKPVCTPSMAQIQDHGYMQDGIYSPRKDSYYEKPPILVVDYNSSHVAGPVNPRSPDNSEQSIKMKMSIVDTILNNDDPEPILSRNRAALPEYTHGIQNTELIELSDDDDMRIKTSPTPLTFPPLQTLNRSPFEMDNSNQPRRTEAIVIEDDSETETDEEVELIRRARRTHNLPSESPKPILY
ncbi:hypothetical protein K7432_018632 [Basidiobolus ranarum]|uniref:[histone H3]-trimethyl-L-lysine(4) demethylase n=1 Tax=Basidiobolus ranarum TaxID=34480 RepID=A0ABR2VY74_9FUNG